MSGAVMSMRWALAMQPRAAPAAGLNLMKPNGCRFLACPTMRVPPAVGGLPGGECLAACAGSEGRWLEIADVIVVPGEAGCRSRVSRSGEMRETLARFPGCAVAAAATGAGGCAAATRDGAVARLVVAGAAGGLRGQAVVCGCVVHAWLVAGRQAAALDRARLRVVRAGGTRQWQVRGHAAGVSFWVGVTAGCPLVDSSAASRPRSWRASGAPASP